MQVKSGCMIVSVDKVDEAVDWLEQISLDIGQKPFQFSFFHFLYPVDSSDDCIAMQTSQTTRSQASRNWTSYGCLGKRSQRYLHQDVIFVERCDRSYCERYCWRISYLQIFAWCVGVVRRRRERKAIDVGRYWCKSLLSLFPR